MARRVSRAQQPGVDLIILDLMLPKPDGYQILRTLRESGIETPVIVLTARGEEADKVRGFRLGADDYVTKPFGLLELLARVDAIRRRIRLGGAATTANDHCRAWSSSGLCASIRQRERWSGMANPSHSARGSSTCCSRSRGTMARSCRAWISSRKSGGTTRRSCRERSIPTSGSFGASSSATRMRRNTS